MTKYMSKPTHEKKKAVFMIQATVIWPCCFGPDLRQSHLVMEKEQGSRAIATYSSWKQWVRYSGNNIHLLK